MNRHRPYRQKSINPYLGISPANRTASGYCYASPNGDNGVIGPRLSYQALAPNGAGGNPTLFSIQHSTFSILNWSYTFSAKEKDSETGLSYFGSRYYSSDLSVWLSVDSMSGKYPSTSPYAYCRNNPLILYDPNGMFDDWVMDKYGVIYWDENAKDQSTTKFGEQYLGRAGQRSYGTAVVNYKSNGTWSFMNPVEIFSDNVTPVNVTANASSVMDDVADWICGNEKYLNGIAFCTGAGGGMVNQAFETSETIGRTADELLSARAMGKVAKTAKCFGFAGEAINIVVAFSNYTKDPTGYNFAKLIVTSTAAFSNCLNAVVPGLGTAVSIGISIIDVNGGFDWLYNKFK